MDILYLQEKQQDRRLVRFTRPIYPNAISESLVGDFQPHPTLPGTYFLDVPFDPISEAAVRGLGVGNSLSCSFSLFP